MKINVEITLPKKKVKKVEQGLPRPEVWPTMLEEEEGVLCGLEFEFFDAYTKKNGDAWGEIEGLYDSVSLTGSRTSNLTSECYWSARTPVTIVQNYYENNSQADPDIIASEFSSDNPDRFNRKPLQVVELANRDSNQRFSGQSAATTNFRIELKSFAGTAERDVSQDLLADGAQKGPANILESTSATDSFTAKFYPADSKPYGLKFSEVGTKSIAHFLDLRDGQSELDYTMDWFDEGLLFCNFDTTDTDPENGNYKVTNEPDFAADECSGLFLNPLSAPGRIKLVAVPRTYGFNTRVMGPKEAGETTVQTYLHVTETAHWVNSILVSDEVAWDAERMPCCPDDYLESWPPGGTMTSCSVYATYSGCGSAYCDSPDGAYSHMWGTGWYWDSVCGGPIDDGGNTSYPEICCNRISAEESDPPGEVTQITYRSYSQQVTPYTFRHYIGLEYGRLPLDFEFEDPQNTEEGPSFFGSARPEPFGAPTLVSDESKADAETHLAQAGASAEDIASFVVGGYNSLHLYQGTPRCPIFASWQNMMSLWETSIFDLIAWSRPDMKSLPTLPSPLGHSDEPGVGTRDNKFQPIWDKIEAGSFWAAHGDKITTGLIEDDVPFGFGVCPSRTGDLVGIVVVGSMPYFVWRRTDEEFTERVVTLQGSDASHNCGFEGMAHHSDENSLSFLQYASRERSGSGGSLDSTKYSWNDANDAFYASNGRRKLTSVLRQYTAECKQNTLGRYELHTDVVTEDPISLCWSGNSGAGSVTLDRPVYVVGAKDIPLNDIAGTWKIYRSNIPSLTGGWPYEERYSRG